MKSALAKIGLSTLLLAACAQVQLQAQPAGLFDNDPNTLSNSTDVENPFDLSWANQPFNAPPFDQIKTEHYLPAIKKAIAAHQAEIEVIINNREEPTFENTLLAFDQSGLALERVLSVLLNVEAAHSTPELRDLMPEALRLETAHSDEVYMNPYLFRRLKSLKARAHKLNFTPVQQRLLDETYKDFVRHGAELGEAERNRLKEINGRLAELEHLFGNHVLSATDAFKMVVNGEAEISGLPDDYKQAAKDRAMESGNKGWEFGLDNPSIMSALQYIENRALREMLLQAYLQRCQSSDTANDNEKVIDELLRLRLEKAKLMGYASFADYVLSDRMASTPDKVYALLDRIYAPGLAKAKAELAMMEPLLRADEPSSKPVFTAADWRFYADRIRREKYSLDENELRPYFSVDAVRNGIFELCKRLYGLRFEEVSSQVSMPTPNTSAYACYDGDGTLLGLIYLDMVTRPGYKGSGAWNTNYVNQRMENGKRVTPVTSIVTNYAAPVGGKPTLLTLDETETFFHEFGHALHNLLANVPYRGLSDVPLDFVELPSQIMEHWATAPEMLQLYARHYETGEVMPQELMDKIKAAGQYGQGFATTEFVAAALLDMDYHTQTKIGKKPIQVEKFEEQQLTKKRGLIAQIPPRYRSTYFNHIMTGGYAVGYYGYLWAEVLDCDAFDAFSETGNIFNPAIATKFRKCVLENGGMYEAMEMYKNFRGREADVQPLLRKRGLSE